MAEWFANARFGLFVHWDHASRQGLELSWPLVGGLFALPKCQSVSVAEYHASAGVAGRALTDRLLRLADDDSAAYAVFAAALKMPKDSDAEQVARRSALRIAARTAAEVPLACVEACHEVVLAAESLAGRSNLNASSDLAVACLLASAAAQGAAANVLVNLPAVGDDAFAAAMGARVTSLLAEIESISSATRAIVASGVLRPAPAGAG